MSTHHPDPRYRHRRARCHGVRVVADYTRDVDWRDGVLRMVPTPTGLNRLFAPVLNKVLGKGLAGDVGRLRDLVEAEASVESVPKPRL